ncbi:MAG TPA: methyltransferase domain-containing protein [Luteitalea sp.]|nr:methyltransferase domain-containing protein [Luteitalea sp.]
MSRDIDALTSYTLKHLRDRWWTARWTHWVGSHLRCDPGERLVHVGCGNGEIDVALALATPGLTVVSVDVHATRAGHTRDLGLDVGLRIHGVAGDLRALPLAPGTADAVLCIGVLQHLQRPEAAAHALAALVRPGGRVLVVEPDHEARYWYSASNAGDQAFAQARATLGRWHRDARPDVPTRLGVHVVSWLRDAGLEPLSVEPLPVAESRLGAPPPGVWDARERLVAAISSTPDRQADGARLLDAITAYRRDADTQGPAFVEVQHALLIATLAQRPQ